MELYAFTCGWQTGRFRGRGTEKIAIPTPAFLIRHAEGDVLVDTGLHPGMGTDPAARVGDITTYFSFALTPEETIAAHLAALDVDPADLHALVLTHLHYDHAGGAALIPPSVELYVQAREWAAGHDADEITANFYLPDDYAQDRVVHALDGRHDLFGDGTVVLIPTPGHSPGHQSVLVTPGDGPPVFLTGDACYFADWLDGSSFPPWGFDRDQERASLAILREHRDAGARLILGHDPVAWQAIPQAPERVL